MMIEPSNPDNIASDLLEAFRAGKEIYLQKAIEILADAQRRANVRQIVMTSTAVGIEVSAMAPDFLVSSEYGFVDRDGKFVQRGDPLVVSNSESIEDLLKNKP